MICYERWGRLHIKYVGVMNCYTYFTYFMSSPRIALCLTGLTGNLGKSGKDAALNPEYAYNHYKKHILQTNDSVDVYIHSWSVEQEALMNALYKPIKSVFEPQEHFNRSGAYLQREIFGVESRVNSTLRCLALVQETEAEQDFRYDYVMVSRFDVAFTSDVHFSELPPQRLVLSHWNDRGLTNNILRGIYDLWFIGNTELLHTYFMACNTDYSLSERSHTFWRILIHKLDLDPHYHLYVGRDYDLVRRMYYDGHGKVNTKHYTYPTAMESRLNYYLHYL